MDNVETIGADLVVGATAKTKSILSETQYLKNTYVFEAFDPQGNLKWTEVAENLVTNVGLDDVLDKYLVGSAYTAVHYVLLTDGTPTPASGDVWNSHAGWTEVTAYTGNRKLLDLQDAVSGQSINNENNKAIFAIDTDATTIGGAGLSTVATNISGVLYSVAAFTGGDKVLGDGDTASA